MNNRHQSNELKRNNSLVPLTPEQRQKLRQAFQEKFNIQDFLEEWHRQSDTLGKAPKQEDVESILYDSTLNCEYWLIEGLCRILLSRSYRDYSTKRVPQALKQEIEDKLEEFKYGRRISWGDFSKLWAERLNDLNAPVPQTVRNFLKPERDTCEYWLVNGLCQILLNCSYDEWMEQWKNKFTTSQNAPIQSPSLPQLEVQNEENELKQRLTDRNNSSQISIIVQSEEEIALPSGVQTSNSAAKRFRDWGEAVDVSVFFGRTEELEKLKQWIVGARCRLVALLGMPRVGKTALSVKLAQQIQDEFEYVIWRSLRSTSSLAKLLADLLEFFCGKQDTNLSVSTTDGISELMKHIKAHRTLIILDEVQTILRPKMRVGYYQEGYQEYAEFFRRIGEELHQSCLLITSRETPKDVTALPQGKNLPVRVFQLQGLRDKEASELLNKLGLTEECRFSELIQLYRGNPSLLMIAARTIEKFYEKNVSKFLDNSLYLGDFEDILEEEFQRLSDLEQQVMYRLTFHQQPISLAQLREELQLKSSSKLVKTLESLEKRSLLEKIQVENQTLFTIQEVFMKYITNQDS